MCFMVGDGGSSVQRRQRYDWPSRVLFLRCALPSIPFTPFEHNPPLATL